MRNFTGIRVILFATAVTAFAVVSGCASAPLNTEESTSGIRAAEEVGAAKVPQASLHLKLAKEELAQAKKLEAKGESLKAASMLQRSETDAELAVALAREESEKAKSLAELENVRQIQKENQIPSENLKSNN
ncbi:MAG TPA: DUF4398 domain-containing protein [bacterium]|nr:DUF4398 domain-containing protein [bacterium]